MSRVENLLRAKVGLSALESGREFYNWYENKWKTNYPDLYRNRWKPSPTMRYYKRSAAPRGRFAKRRMRRRRLPSRKRKRSEIFSKGRIGQKIGTSVPKVYRTNYSDNSALATRTLYGSVINDVPHSANNDINERQRNVVNCRGFNVYVQIKNTTSIAETFNLALVVPRFCQETTEGTLPTLDFFRDPTTDTRGVDFASALPNIAFSKFGINPDKYIVLKHKRYLLNAGVTGGSTTDEDGKNYRNIEWYVPLKRQLRYRDVAFDDMYQHVWVVYWLDHFQNVGGSLPIANQANCSLITNMVFREPK